MEWFRCKQLRVAPAEQGQKLKETFSHFFFFFFAVFLCSLATTHSLSPTNPSILCLFEEQTTVTTIEMANIKIDSLTEEQLQNWDRDGFLILSGEQLFSPEDLQLIIQWTGDVEQWPDAPGKWMKYYSKSVKDDSKLLHRVENFFPYHENFDKTFNSEKFLHLVSQLFKEKAILHKEKINFKYPGGEGFEPHQDHAAGWWMYNQTLHISMLVTIDQATTENGW